MGLSVEVVKFNKINCVDMDSAYYFKLTDDNGNYDDRGFKDWALKKKTEITEKWIDLEKYKEDTCIDIKNDYEVDSIHYGDDEYIYKLTKKSDGSKLKINIDVFPIVDKNISVVYYDTISSISRPFNGDFYDDFDAGKTKRFLWTKEEVMDYFNKYCIKEKINIDLFTHQIINKFKEGETLVYISW